MVEAEGPTLLYCSPEAKCLSVSSAAWREGTSPAEKAKSTE